MFDYREDRSIYEKYDFSGKKILIVEDEEVNYLLVKDILEDTNADVSWAQVGQQAIDLVQESNNYDLILMDLKMPILDGIDTTREIRKRNQDVPIIAHTAYTMPEEQIRCKEAGCNDYISKPIIITELFRILDNHLNKQSTNPV